MKRSLLVVLLASAIVMSALLAPAEGEEEWIAEYLDHYRQLGISDSLLTQLEANLRQAAKDSTWLAKHVEIQRKMMLEYRINKLRELVRTGTPEEKAAAEAKIQELLEKEANR